MIEVVALEYTRRSVAFCLSRKSLKNVCTLLEMRGAVVLYSDLEHICGLG